MEILAAYTRAEALADGTLVEVSELAREAGIRAPTAVTRAVWEQYVALSPAARQAGNDEIGRLWDIVSMVRCAALRNPDASEVVFSLRVVIDRLEPELVELRAVCGPGDDGETVITIMLPDED